MKTDWPLTQNEVDIYRYLYYDHYKVLVFKGIREEEDLVLAMKKPLDEVGWSFSRFMDYKSIDLMQRLVTQYANAHVDSGASTEPMTSKAEYRHYDPNYGALTLKDNDRSDDPDIPKNTH